MTDLVLADCNLPESPVSPGYFHEINAGTPAAGLKISVSNDGEHRSKETLTLISYDSACMSCNISSGCSLKVCKFRTSTATTPTTRFYYVQDFIAETVPSETTGLSDKQSLSAEKQMLLSHAV